MKQLTRREFVKLSATAVAGTILTACAPAAPAPAEPEAPKTEATKAPEAEEPEAPAAEEATKAPEAEPEAPAAPETPARTWPLGDVPRNQTLIFSFGVPVPGVHSPFSASYNHQIGNAVLYEPCAYYGAHADKTYMWLAESYKYNEDATQMDVTFRKGIMWSDGTPFTANDPAYFMNMLAANPGFRGGGTYSIELEEAVAVDDLNLKVTLKQHDFRLFFKSLTFRFDLGDDTVVQPMHYFKDVDPAELDAYPVYDLEKGWPISTGPYGVGSSTDQICNFDLRPTWWAVETGFVEKYPDVVRLQNTAFTNDTVAGQQMINNECDQPMDMRPMVIASVLAQGGDHLTSWTGNQMPYGYMDWWPTSVWFCTEKPPVNDARVRWAVSYAINREQLIQVAYGGAGQPANSPFPGFKRLNEYMDGIKDLTDQYNVLEFNPEKSAALMEEAGYKKDAQGYWVDASGVRPDFDLYAGVPLFGDIGPVIAQMLDMAGFNCAHKAPNDVWAAKTDGRASLFLFGHGGSTIDPYDTFNLYRRSEIKPMGEQSPGNMARWSTDKTEEILEEMNKTAMDDPKMKDLFREWMTEYYRELPDAPLSQWFHRVPLNTTYWSNWPTQENPYMNAALWHLTAPIVIYGLKATGA